MKRMIVTNEEFLRQKSEIVEDQELANLIIKDLEDTLKIEGGVGLAAPQIGFLKKIAIIRYGEFNLNIINPTDINLSKEKLVFQDEGCLSFPGIRKNTLRSKSISFINGFANEAISFNNKGIITVAIQHEIDHLDGVLLFDRMMEPIKSEKIGRNDKCPCGSGKKYKKCCA